MTISSDLSLEKRVANVCSSDFYWLRQLRRVRRSPDTDSMKTLVHAFVMSRVDYCNAILAGSPRYITDKLQRLLNATARLITATRKFDHGLSFLLHDELHWLDIPERVRPLQAGSNSAPMSARQGPQVPGRLLHTSLRHCQQTTSALCQSTSPDSTTSPAQYFWSSGLLCRRSDGLEFTTG